MRALVFGADGQLGRALLTSAEPADVCIGITRKECDITDEVAVRNVLGAHHADVVFIAAAYTNVDGAEDDPAAAKVVNVDGARHVARAGHALGCHVVYFSTDYVFDGAQSHPYRVTDRPNPVNVYGSSKLAGELAVAEATEGSALILRTAWLYSSGGRNFLAAMLRAMRSESDVRVVDDQVGTPTAASSVARAAWTAAPERLAGVQHWTDAGVATWYDFACAIASEATSARILTRPPRIVPIASAEYPSPARRPAYSVLDKHESWRAIGVQADHWRSELARTLMESANG